MRAKLPDKEGFAERNGNRIHYEVYGQGPQTMVFLPPWSIVHSRVYKAQIPYFSERFRCIAYDALGNGRSRPAGRRGRLFAEQLRGRRACGHGRDRRRRGHPGRPVVRRSARLLPRCLSSRARQGRDPRGRVGRSSGRTTATRRPSTSWRSARRSRAGTSTIAPTGWRTIPTSPSISSRTSSASRTRPGRSRTGWPGPTTPAARCW